jgi:hypothetical protein
MSIFSTSRLKFLPDLLPALLAALALAFMLPLSGHAETAADAYRLSGPMTHDNLAVYFVHGESRPGPVPLTLQEGLAKQAVEVRETGSVNELQVMNTGDEAVYIQAGDIVKGGRQDRVLVVSTLLPPKSDLVSIPVFCVEHGRWSGRGDESATKFESADALMPSRAAKLAMRGGTESGDADQPVAGNARPRPQSPRDQRAPVQAAPAVAPDSVAARQQRVWRSVDDIQGKLSSNLNTQVASVRSRTSLQLALENENLGGKQAEFVDSLQKSGEADSDIIGYVVAINGRLNSAEIYPSNSLFLKMWPRLLRASATEAIQDRAAKDGNGESRPLPATADVMTFLRDPSSANGADQAAANAKVKMQQGKDAAMFESRPAAAPAAAGWINRSYIAR